MSHCQCRGRGIVHRYDRPYLKLTVEPPHLLPRCVPCCVSRLFADQFWSRRKMSATNGPSNACPSPKKKRKVAMDEPKRGMEEEDVQRLTDGMTPAVHNLSDHIPTRSRNKRIVVYNMVLWDLAAFAAKKNAWCPYRCVLQGIVQRRATHCFLWTFLHTIALPSFYLGTSLLSLAISTLAPRCSLHLAKFLQGTCQK